MNTMDKKKFDELCERMMVKSPAERELFFQGYTLGYLDGQLDTIKGRHQSSPIPDAETR